MTEHKHTPGPWLSQYRDTPNGGLSMQVFPASDPDNTIATCHWHSVKTKTGFTTDRQANARLIAAAPDMLDDHKENTRILGFLVNELQGIIPAGKLEALQKCRDRSLTVIAKAKGQEIK